MNYRYVFISIIISTIISIIISIIIIHTNYYY